jgi:hypothetical protein
MLIKSPDDKAPLSSCSGAFYYDEVGNKYHDVIRRISINPESQTARLERISLMYTDDASPPFIYKECGVGPIETVKKSDKGDIKFKNYSYSVNDINEGCYVQSGGYSFYPSENPDCDSYVYYGYMNHLVPSSINVEDESYKKITMPSLASANFTLSRINDEVAGFENLYQLPYTETLGLLNSFFSTWTYSYPFECYVYIDTKKKCFNIPKIIYLPYIGKDDIGSLYAKFIQEVSSVCMYLSHIIEKENQAFNIIIFLHPFGSVVRIIDKYRCLKELFFSHHSTQVQNIMKNVKAGGLKYIGSEGLGLLEESVLNKPVDHALTCCDAIY